MKKNETIYTGTIPHSRPTITIKDRNAVNAVMKSGMIAEGSLVTEFEKAMSKYLGLSGGVATSSGTDALFLALKALNVGNGDEVIIPTYVCRAVWDAVQLTGATPVLCDVGKEWCTNAELINPYITERTKAIIPAHIFGMTADIAPICDIGIPVIEDCCQALGVKRDNQMIGTFGDFCILSFHATKLLTTGEGGMVLTKEPKLLEKLQFLKNGQDCHLIPRYRRPMSDLQAALGLSQLSQYNHFLRKRRKIADHYFNSLGNLAIKLPVSICNHSIFFRFPLRVTRGIDEIQSLFNAEGIQVRRGVDALLHRQWGLPPKKYPGAEQCFDETLSIPIYPSLQKEELNYIVRECNNI